MRQWMMATVVGFGFVLGTAAASLAAPGFATGNVNLRAGPGTTYPQVVVVPNGAPVEIFGCLDGYGWCDVGFNGVRGWVSSGYLQYSREGRRVPFARYGGEAGVPIVTFQFGNYWGDHYRDRPWFGDRDRWGGPPRRGPDHARDRDPGWDRGSRGDQGPGRGPGWDRGPGDDRGAGRGPGWDRGPGDDRGPGRSYGGDRGPGDRGPNDRGPNDRGPGDRGPGDRASGGERGPGPGFDQGPGRGPGPDRGPPDGGRFQRPPPG